MTEGPLIGDAPRKGKRNPQIAAELLAAQMQEEAEQRELEASAGEEPFDSGLTVFRSGRNMVAKVAIALEVGSPEPAWFTFGLGADPEIEDLEEQYTELVDAVNSGALGLAANMQERLQEIAEQNRTRPIQPQSRR